MEEIPPPVNDIWETLARLLFFKKLLFDCPFSQLWAILKGTPH